MEREITPSSCCTFEDVIGSSPESIEGFGGEMSSGWFEIERHQIVREIQQMVNRYNDCFCRLQGSISTLEFLRGDNLQLAAENLELIFLIEENESSYAAGEELDFIVPFEKNVGGAEVLEKEATAPLSGSCMPKSISIRSPGFLTVKSSLTGGPKGLPPASGGIGGVSDFRSHRLRLPVSADQEEGEEEALEVEVYEQGAAKTELCNKWGETGRCPYGARCRFAHGLSELRPVIRHPRYKTQPCRMLGANGCPYGHRCHFRHAALPDPDRR